MARSRSPFWSPPTSRSKSSETALIDYLQRVPTPPDGIFCGSDTMALAVLGVLRRKRIKVPTHTSLIGYDDIPAAGQHDPGLTTIRQDTALAGGLLVDRIMQLVAGERANQPIFQRD